ncbi:kinase-like domain-containing protein, partial [Blyttiomyces helicus]
SAPPNPAGLSEGSFNQGYYDRFFVEQKKLGRGLRGSVFLCQHILDQVPLGEFAVKAIPVGSSHAWLVRMLREVHLLERLRHPNIIEYKHAWLENRQPTVFGPEVPCLFILMELANGGNLEEFIQMQHAASPALSTPQARVAAARRRSRSTPTHRSLGPEYLNEREIWCMFLDVCDGLKHLHSHGIIHRDLKPPNLLLHYDEGVKTPRVLISDFGECEVVSDERRDERTGATGTLEFMPPELLVRSSAGAYTGVHSPKADMWSLGIVLHFLCFSRVPYSQVDDVDILREEILGFSRFVERYGVAADEVEKAIALKSLIVRLLAPVPKNRPTIDEIL